MTEATGARMSCLVKSFPVLPVASELPKYEDQDICLSSTGLSKREKKEGATRNHKEPQATASPDLKKKKELAHLQ